MKKFIRVLSFMLIFTLMLPVTGFAAGQEDSRSGDIRFISYNIQGLPFISGAVDAKTAKTKIIGSLLTKNAYDVACLQEDFFFHAFLEPEIDLPYSSRFSGAAPVGDGLSIYSAYKMYSTTRVRWNKAAGVFDGASDALTPKGFMVTTLEIADGVFIDIYDLHADANSEPLSLAARRDNYAQLAAFMNEYSADRAVVVMGDFNGRLSNPATGLYDLLIGPCGLKDAWCETANGGDYKNVSPNAPDGGNYRGHWDSIDRLMYRDGGGVSLDIVSHDYVPHRNDAGESLSDHDSVEAVIHWEVTGDLLTYDDLKPGDTIGFFEDIVRKIKIFTEVVVLVLSEIPALIYTKVINK